MLKSTIEKFESKNVIDLYNKGYSLNQLEKIVRSDKRVIRDYLLAKGVDVKTTKTHLKPTEEELIKNRSDLVFNFHKFDIIDTEEKAYWLGFIYADGYISKDNSFEITLKAEDVGHLHKFNRFLECNINRVSYHPKKTSEKIYDLYRFSIQNDTMGKALNSHGVIPNKSLVLTFPETSTFSNEDLIRHFIRGYFDGDGCISGKMINVLGTESMLNGIKRYITVLKDKNLYKKDNIYILQTSHKKALSVLNYLYKDANIYLDRKHQKFLEFCRSYEQSYELSVGKNGELCDENTVLID